MKTAVAASVLIAFLLVASWVFGSRLATASTLELARQCAGERIQGGYPSTACIKAGLAWNQFEPAVPRVAR